VREAPVHIALSQLWEGTNHSGVSVPAVSLNSVQYRACHSSSGSYRATERGLLRRLGLARTVHGHRHYIHSV